MLAPTDYEIIEAEDGEQALAVMAKQRPDLGCDCLLASHGKQHFGLALDTVYSIRDAVSCLREFTPALADFRSSEPPSPHA